jgi:hypothetical protein
MSTTVLPKRDPEDRHPISTPIEKSRKDTVSEGHKQGVARAKASAQVAKDKGSARLRYYNEAVDYLRNAQPSTAVEKMRELPLALLEMFLVAEMENQNRDSVLMYFPKPGAQAREQWLGPVEPKKKRPVKKAEVAQEGTK